MEKLEKYIELKETIETFLKKRNELKKRVTLVTRLLQNIHTLSHVIREYIKM